MRGWLMIASICSIVSCGRDKGDSGDTCPIWATPVSAGVVADARIAEASGLVASPVHDGIVWTHNDDDADNATLYALGVDGTVRGTLVLSNAEPVDWEAITATSEGGIGILFVGDIGDNDANRDSIVVVRVTEPSNVDGDNTAPVLERFRFHWPDGPTDAEAMFVYPGDNRIYVVSRDAHRALVMRLPVLTLANDDTNGEIVSEIDLDADGLAGFGAVRGADVDADGGLVLRLSDAVVWYPPRSSVAASFAAFPCAVPSPAESDGEAVAAVGEDLYFLGEGASPTLWRVAGSGR